MQPFWLHVKSFLRTFSEGGGTDMNVPVLIRAGLKRRFENSRSAAIAIRALRFFIRLSCNRARIRMSTFISVPPDFRSPSVEFQIDEKILCYRRRVSWNQPGHAHFLTFSCHGRQPFLRSEGCCRWLADSVRNTCDKLQFRLWAYVFMPEHVHLLVYPFCSNYRIAEFLKAIKVSVARRTVFRLKKNGRIFCRSLPSSRRTEKSNIVSGKPAADTTTISGH